MNPQTKSLQPPCEKFESAKTSASQLIIGITGGIGSGKTAVAELIRASGHTVLSSDDIAHELMASSPTLHRQIIERFPHVAAFNGGIDRQRLAATVFGSDDAQTLALQALNAIVHPAVFQELARRVAEYFRAGESLVFNETALLFETGLAECYDLAIVVDAPESARLQRLTDQRGLSLDDAKRRIASQISAEAKRAAADVVIDNSGSLDELQQRVSEVLHALREGTLHSIRNNNTKLPQ
jgi:dephospho-CoA kinase